MNVSFEAKCKTSDCKNILRMYVPPHADIERRQWCCECDQVHAYTLSDFHTVRMMSATSFPQLAASMATGD